MREGTPSGFKTISQECRPAGKACLLGQDVGNNALVSGALPFYRPRKFFFLGYIDSNQLVYSAAFIALFPGKTFTSTTIPIRRGTRRKYPHPRAFSPKIARRSLSSAVSSVSLWGNLANQNIPARTSAPMRIIPSSKSFKASSPTLGCRV